MKNKVALLSVLVLMGLFISPLMTLAAGINVSILKPANNAEFTVNENISFSAKATGGDPSFYDFTWNWDDGGIISSYDTVTTADYAYDTVGTKNIVLTVQDMDGNSGSANVKVKIVEEAETDLIISNIKVSNITTNSAVITWTTNKPATSRVIYDTISRPNADPKDKPNHGYANSTETDQNKVVSHSMKLTGLKSNTKYYFRVISTATN